MAGEILAKPSFVHTVDSLVAPYLNESDDFVVAHALDRLGMAIERSKGWLFKDIVLPQRAAEFLIDSIPHKSTLLAAVIGIVDARGKEDEILTPQFQELLALDDDENMRRLLHSAAGENRRHLEANLDHSKRDNAFLPRSAARDERADDLRYEIVQLLEFQEAILEQEDKPTKPSGERE